MREDYFDGRDMSSMRTAGVYAQTVAASRVTQSATSQLQGLFDTELTFPDLEPESYPLVYEQDGLLYVNSWSCRRMQGLNEDIQFSDEWREFFYDEAGRLLDDKLYGWLIAETGLNRDLYEESDMAKYVYLA